MWSKKWRTLIAFVLGLSLVVALIRPVHPRLFSSGMIIGLNPQGQVKLKRSSWQAFKPAFIGHVLKGNDQLLVARDAAAKVLCSNWTKWTPPVGRTSIVNRGCNSTSRGNIVISPDSTPPPRATNNKKIPYLLSPRQTSLLNNQPILRWNKVEGVDNYRVRVIGPQVNWKTETSETEILYPEEQPLQPGSYYWLIVETDQGISSLDEGVFGFTVLDEEKVTEISIEKDKLPQQKLSGESEVLALAHFYRSQELNADAIELLEREVSDGSQSVAVYQLLGDIYQQVGLNRLARKSYLTGEELAQAAADLDSQATMQWGLVITNEIIGNKDEALQWIKQGLESYQVLGDESKVDQLNSKFKIIKQF